MKIFVILAVIVGVSNASTSELFHGATRTVIEGPSGTIVQETPGAHILKSFVSSKLYAPSYSAAVAVPERFIAEPARIVPTPLYHEPLVHRVLPEPVVPAPVVRLPAPVLPEPYLPHSSAYPYAFPEHLAFSSLPVPYSPYLESRVAPAPTFFEPTIHVPAPVPVLESKFFLEPPVYAERLVHPAPFVPAPVEVAPIGVYPAKTIPEVVFGKYPPTVPVRIPATEYGL